MLWLRQAAGGLSICGWRGGMTSGSHQEARQAGLVTALKEGRLDGDGADRGQLLRWGCGRNGCGGEPEVSFELMYFRFLGDPKG